MLDIHVLLVFQISQKSPREIAAPSLTKGGGEKRGGGGRESA